MLKLSHTEQRSNYKLIVYEAMNGVIAPSKSISQQSTTFLFEGQHGKYAENVTKSQLSLFNGYFQGYMTCLMCVVYL